MRSDMKWISLKCVLALGFLSLSAICFAEQKSAEFPGGNDALAKYLQSSVSYPSEAVKNNEFGQVLVSFVVDADGSVKEVKVVRGVSSSLDTEAVRVVNAMPKWTPSTKDGNAVKSQLSLPIVFHLPNNVLRE